MRALQLASISLVFVLSACSSGTKADPRNESINSALTEEDVRRIVLEELAFARNESKRNQLSDLLKEYSFADESTSSMMYGSNTARFTLQMFSDIECPFCRQMFFEVKKVVDQSEGVINWEYKHFPLAMHNPIASLEAQAVECIAVEQGRAKAWVALDQFIKSTHGNGKGVQDDLPDFVRSFGLNGSLLKNCLATNDSKRRVNADYGEGVELGISATPAVVLIDNQSGKNYLIKGKKSAGQLLQAIQSIM